MYIQNSLVLLNGNYGYLENIYGIENASKFVLYLDCFYLFIINFNYK